MTPRQDRRKRQEAYNKEMIKKDGERSNEPEQSTDESKGTA